MRLTAHGAHFTVSRPANKARSRRATTCSICPRTSELSWRANLKRRRGFEFHASEALASRRRYYLLLPAATRILFACRMINSRVLRLNVCDVSKQTDIVKINIRGINYDCSVIERVISDAQLRVEFRTSAVSLVAEKNSNAAPKASSRYRASQIDIRYAVRAIHFETHDCEIHILLMNNWYVYVRLCYLNHSMVSAQIHN